MMPTRSKASATETNSAYEAADSEVAAGVLRPGIDARARVESQESGRDVKAVYLRLLAEQILEDSAEKKKENRRGVIIAGSTAAVKGLANWFKEWLKYSAISFAVLVPLGLAFGFQMLNETSPGAEGWNFESRLGGASFIGLLLFGPTAFLICCMFTLPVLRRNWMISAAIAVIPTLFIHHNLRSNSKARAGIESRLSEQTPDSASRIMDEPSTPAKDPLGKSYHDRVQQLRRDLFSGDIKLYLGSPRVDLPQGLMEMTSAVAEALERANTWWLENETVYVYISNSAALDLAAIEFTLTPGPCARPSGQSISTTYLFDEALSPSRTGIVAFGVPVGADLTRSIDCGTISNSWGIFDMSEVPRKRQETPRDSEWSPGPAKDTYGLPAKLDCPTQINSRYYRDCDGAIVEGMIK